MVNEICDLGIFEYIHKGQVSCIGLSDYMAGSSVSL